MFLVYNMRKAQDSVAVVVAGAGVGVDKVEVVVEVVSLVGSGVVGSISVTVNL